MEKERTYRVKSAVMGGGLALRQGQVVQESELKGYAEWLRSSGAVEEIHNNLVDQDPVPGIAYTA